MHVYSIVKLRILKLYKYVCMCTYMYVRICIQYACIQGSALLKGNATLTCHLHTHSPIKHLITNSLSVLQVHISTRNPIKK